jgi:DNA-binding XRE family transcriptional regulator
MEETKIPVSTNCKNIGGRPRKIKCEDINLTKMEEQLAEYGLTDKQLAKALGVTEQTINNYKKDYPEFFESLKRGKDIADAKVELALYQRAVGYSHPDVHISNFKGKITITQLIKHYPPDPTSMIFWLKNRQPLRWKEKNEIVPPEQVRIFINGIERY